MSDPTPRVSVLVPCCDDGVYLGAALASLRAQTFTDFEAVICDDASTDDTAAVADSLAAGDARMRVVRQPARAGMSANWNRALAAARAPLVLKLDADDALAPHCLERLVTALERHPGAPSAFCRTVDCDPGLTATGAWQGEAGLRAAGLDPEHEQTASGGWWYRRSFDDYQLFHSRAGMHRTQALRHLGGWDGLWSCAAGTDLILRLLETQRPIVHVPYVGVRCRRRPDSVSGRGRTFGWLRLESALVHLRSLDRHRAMGRPVDARLRLAWWRLWCVLRAAESGPALERAPAPVCAPAPVRERLQRARTLVADPPLDVRAYGRARFALSALRRAWPGGS